MLNTWLPKLRQQMIGVALEKYSDNSALQTTLRQLINSKVDYDQIVAGDLIWEAYMDLKGLKFIAPEYQHKP